MKNKSLLRPLIRLGLVIFYFFICKSLFSQTQDELQKLYDRTYMYAYISEDLGKTVKPIPNLTEPYKYMKGLDYQMLYQSFVSKEPISLSSDLTTITDPYFENLFIRTKKGLLINLHQHRGDNSYQPQSVYKQIFAIYKIKLPSTTVLSISNQQSIIDPTEMYLGVSGSSLSGSYKDMMHIFAFIHPNPGIIGIGGTLPDKMDIKLPPGEYYLLTSSSQGGMRSVYHRGVIKTDITVIDIEEVETPISPTNTINFAYDLSGNRISRTIPIATRTLMAYEEPEVIITEEVAKRDIKIYSSIEGQVSVEFSSLEGMKNGTMQIYSFPGGTPVLTRKIKNLREDLDISYRPSGVYILMIDIDGEKTSYKLMK